MSSARPVTAESGSPPPRAFAVVMRSGDDSLVLAGEHRAGAAEAGLDLVGDEDDAVLACELGDAGEETGAGTMKPPSPWIGSMTIAATFRRRSG